jgi:hypothetical protein
MKCATARQVRTLRDGRRITLATCPECRRDAYVIPVGQLAQCPSCTQYFEISGVGAQARR